MPPGAFSYKKEKKWGGSFIYSKTLGGVILETDARKLRGWVTAAP